YERKRLKKHVRMSFSIRVGSSSKIYRFYAPLEVKKIIKEGLPSGACSINAAIIVGLALSKSLEKDIKSGRMRLDEMKVFLFKCHPNKHGRVKVSELKEMSVFQKSLSALLDRIKAISGLDLKTRFLKLLS
ncbi:MAG: hypothetical protein QXL46_03740, partial [Nitrososphaerales archaeon]